VHSRTDNYTHLEQVLTERLDDEQVIAAILASYDNAATSDPVAFDGDGEDLRWLNRLVELFESTPTPEYARSPDSDWQERRSADPFYGPLGLDSSELAAAHRWAATLTSGYRRLGYATEHLVREAMADRLGVTPEQLQWSYKTDKKRARTLDARLALDELPTRAARRLKKFLDDDRSAGAVFEIRQGYKSCDSKRRNADRQSANAIRRAGFTPVLLVVSDELSPENIASYTKDGWKILKGADTMAFLKDVVGFDLGGMLDRNRDWMRAKVRIAW
jgi:hypothetical protein